MAARQVVVVVAAIKRTGWARFLTVNKPKKPRIASNQSLQALTLAALALPGLMLNPACAEEDEVEFQYGHYQEGKRNLFTTINTKNPIEVDSLLGKAKFSLSDRVKFAFNYTQDTWSGATPISTAPRVANSNRPILADTPSGQTITVGASPYLNTQLLVNRNYIPLKQKPNGRIAGQDTQLVHILSMASPETRKQGDFNLAYEWDETALDLGGGISVENDYESRFGSLNGRWDFNQKLTRLNLGLSYTNSDTSAILDHDSSPYITKSEFLGQIEQSGAMKIMHGNRQDWSSSLGLTQILNKEALFSANIGYTRSTGYLENPYKAMSILFVDSEQGGNRLNGELKAFLEQRPNERNQLNLGGRFIQHIGLTNAALHVDYRFFHDDWGINAHTFEADWVQPIGRTWTITPRIRYYSQDAADFYQPYLLSKQAFAKTVYNEASGTFSSIPFDARLLPQNFSSDQRLSAYGALSGGVTVNKQFSKAIGLEAGFEYYSHAGALKMGGGGEGSYSDFDYFMANASLKVNLAAMASPAFAEQGHHAHHAEAHHHGNPAPAGVMFGHLLNQAHAFMVGYRFMYGRQSGDMLHGSQLATDRQIVNGGCGSGVQACRLTPTYMDMSMHMLDIMYAPTDWLNVMVMPQFMDMAMNLRQLAGAPPVQPGEHVHTGTGHATGGVGDTGLYALIKLLDQPVHHVHLGLGLSAPTGDVDIPLRRNHQQDEGFIHYGMQLGSGTWDFKPSLTYIGQSEAWSWGAQLSGTHRMEDKNQSGFTFGDIFQSTAWGGYGLTPWLSTTVRGVYTDQTAVSGRFNATSGVVNGVLLANVNPKAGPMDFPSSYGGRYWDVGFGLNARVPSGDLAGNSFGVEWLQPVSTDVNGYQLDREGALSATWQLMF